MTTTSDVVAACQRLMDAMEPWAWAEVTDRHLLDRAMQPVSTQYEVRAVVKLDGLPACQEAADQKGAYAQARRVREFLVHQAETAILAVEQAGFRHAEHPRIEVSGHVRVHYKEPHRPDELDMCRVEVIMTLEERS